MASIAVLNELRLNLKLTHSIFKDFEPSVGRGRIHSISRYGKQFKIIDESYNANHFQLKMQLVILILLKSINLKNTCC